MTADEFIEERFSEIPWQYIDIVKLMKDFAAHHVILALEIASNVAVIEPKGMMTKVNKDSILNAYPLENIK